MLKINFAILIAFFTAIASALAQLPKAATQPNMTMVIREPTDLPLNVTGHLPVIEVKINGNGPYHFALDTGFAGIIEITDTLAKQLAIPAIDELTVSDPSGRDPIKSPLFRAESVDIGSAHFGGVSVSETARRMPGDTDGVIGLGLFKRLLVKLDYVNGRFMLRQGELSAESSLKYNDESGVPDIEISVNGVKANVDIDTGSPALVTLPLSMAESLPLATKPRVVGHGRAMGGDFDVYGASINGEVRVGGLVLTNPRLDFVSIFPKGNLGYRFFKDSIITFDPANRRVQFEKPSLKAAGQNPEQAEDQTGKP